MKGNTTSSFLPPGFRFHPTDEELIVHYLSNQATSKPCPASIIPEVNVYKFDPWQLPEKAEFGEKEWYFFSPRDRKYPNGVRPNRAAVSGYWKATGTDKAIYSGSKFVGVKKALVFYKGRPPKGVKTDWIMHEYRLNEARKEAKKRNGSMRLDDWVLCRIYKKKNAGRSTEDRTEISETQPDEAFTAETNKQHEIRFPPPCSLTHLFELDYMVPLTELLNDNNAYNLNFETHNFTGNAGNEVKIELGDLPCHQFPNPASFHANQIQGGIFNQSIFVDPTAYRFQ